MRQLILVFPLVFAACSPSAPVSVGARSSDTVLHPSCAGYPANNGSSVTVCDARHYGALAASGKASVRSSSGDVLVLGSQRSDVDLDAFVYASAPTQQAAEDLASKITIHTDNNDYYASAPGTGCTVEAGGACVSTGSPSGGNTLSYSVSFVVQLPRPTDVTASNSSGPVEVDSVTGSGNLSSSSGDLYLSDLAGSVSADTSSGNIQMNLSGSSWSGSGVTLGSSSGDVAFFAPGSYSAQFKFSTTSGTIHSDFSGADTGGDYSETLGKGGATLSADTTSGNISLLKK